MLRCTHTGPSGELRVVWETPPSAAILQHPELASFLSRMETVPGLRAGAEGLHVAFRVPYHALVDAFAPTLPPGVAACHRHCAEVLAGRPDAPRTEDGLEVNFHQHPFDTPDRAWLFTLRQGRFAEYFFNRLAWHLAPTYHIVTPFPLHVDLESASTCNMNCPMCYRDMLPDAGQMDFDLFCRLIDECAASDLYSVRLSWRGETLTHPRITEMIAYAAARIPNVSFLTNAFYLDERICACLVENRVSYVAVSFDGIGQVYETIRAPAKFQESMDRLRMLRRLRQEAGSLLPQIRTCTIWPAVRHDPQAYQRAMGEVADYMVKNPYINFKGAMTLKEGFVCQYPWERIVVGWNGVGQCCTGWNAGDIALGDARAVSIAEMWRSPRQEEVRRMHLQGRRLEIPCCRDCRHGAAGDPDASIEDIVQRRW
ncbi:radical SAM/SPASM domain-containing protein [Solidesulfovibrio magneticus]|uniref:radical SAM/SPASM domain-containing protein n=1 Tax=Solidesulfovibrio magneticus TaxID=184917 RepID=UPI0005BE16DC|nr:radical SAM protein [Solidesulfovibrio magneticus]